MRQFGTFLAAASLSLSPVLADDAADFSDALGKAATGALLAQAYMDACDLHDPASQQTRRDAMAGWSHRVDLSGYERLMAGATQRLPGLAEGLEQQTETLQQAVIDDVIADRSTCTDFKAALAEEKFDIAQPIRYLLRTADDFGIEVAEPKQAPVSDDVEVVPLAMLSAQLAAKMDEIGSKRGADSDRDLRDARQDHAEAWLEQRLALVLFGRVTAEDELRQWRDDQQSTFLASCSSFANDAEEAAMAANLGRDRILLGEIRWLREDREGGEISLNDCRLFVHNPDEFPLATVADDSAGLMLRPPEYDEIFAGPNQGIAISEIDRVLYDAEFFNRMDGFGNGYTYRREDIYVLLRDGTAYRHEWNFAFTDIDVALSRQREPDRWFTWSDARGTVTLTQTGGLDKGTEIDLGDARALAPMPAGQTLDQTYYYLNVGMGGGRSDRDYAFSPDGQLVHIRGGFVAGNFGTSYIISVGEDDVARSTYAFDGYTLLIDGPDGQERHFVALIEGDDPARPEEIIIDGQVHWLRGDDD